MIPRTLPKRDETVITDLVERSDAVYRRMRAILRNEWKHTVVRAEEARGRNDRKLSALLVRRANDFCRAYDALAVEHHTAMLLLKTTNLPANDLPPPYDELENAPDRAVRRWILDWITEARERLA